MRCPYCQTIMRKCKDSYNGEIVDGYECRICGNFIPNDLQVARILRKQRLEELNRDEIF